MALNLPIHPPTATDDVLADLARDGLALLDAVPGRARLLDLARALDATVVSHRDSDPDGVTVIEDRGLHAAAFAGFTRLPLIPHTDRSGLADPPDLLLTACGREPVTGGESILVDGRAVYLDLARTTPEALRALGSPRSALFGGADGYLGAVFEPGPADVVTVRFRRDALVRFGPRAAPHVPALMAAIDRHALTIPVCVASRPS